MEQSQNTSQPTSPSEIQHSKPDTNSMEVHHHPDIHHKSKRWKEYFIEFLMIFLAVTLGFFAETVRETTTEHKRAREFAVSMVKDLEDDKVQLKGYRDYFAFASKNIDTLLQLLTVAEPKDIPSGKLYWYGLWGGAHNIFVPNDATFQQMRSSGSLRFYKEKVANDVARYDRFCKMMQDNEEKQLNIYVEIRKIRAEMFDFRYNTIANSIYQDLKVTHNYNKLDSFMKVNPPLLSYDKILFNQYIELVRSRFIHFNIDYADSLLNLGSVLIGELEKGYNLDN